MLGLEKLLTLDLDDQKQFISGKMLTWTLSDWLSRLLCGWGRTFGMDFFAGYLQNLIVTSINRIIGVPEVLSVLVSEFGKHLFETGQSIYLYRQLVTHIQREDPNMRGKLGLAWQTLNRWDYIEPVCHRTPLPYAHSSEQWFLQQSI